MQKSNSTIFHLICLLVLSCNTSWAVSPQKTTRQEYIDVYAQLAIQEMNEFHIPASITMAQACLESGNGNSMLASEANNHFGIKCNSSWTGPSVRKDDDSRNECFRKYKTAIESFRDHSVFLTGSLRYQFLFDYKITDYRKWAYGLKKAGYATDPHYPERLIKIIEEFELHKLDGYYNSTTRYVKPERFASAAQTAAKRKSTGTTGGFSINPYDTRKVERRNGSKAFFAKEGDTYEQIAAEFSMKEWEIFKYNDVEKGARPAAGSIVYLQSKRGSAPRGNEYHVMKKGESLWSVAQWYGVRMSVLYRKNKISEGDLLQPGQKISLRKKVRK